METPRIEDLLAEALAKPASERDAFVHAACAGDGALQAEIDSLLKSHDEAGEFMGEPSVMLQDASPDDSIGEREGAQIGRYRLLQRIGEGGFGTVFMAEQREPVRRRVALKVIKLGMDTRQVIARFEAERQALAMMDHPAIARVLDAGATEGGRPYFVMELVRGEPITAYCDSAAMPIRARLELFREVCHAVQHAHQKGIIHRDLKPSNILVGEIDGRATPKIIDFGIAKAMGSGAALTEKTLFTDFRQFVGTPEYMSPEQAGMGAEDVDTRSDIYALGVLLYELLTGGPPFDAKKLRSAAWEEMRRIIREDQPQCPSTRLNTGQNSREVAARRRSEPAGLIGQVRGDLDWIAMKCLEKDRARRYETANALAMDIGRDLAGEPVLAAPPSRAYRLRKYLRRHRAQAVAGSLVALSLLAAVVGTTTFAVRERNRARETERVADFQARVLGEIEVSRMGERLRQNIFSEAEEGWRRERLAEEEFDTRRKGLASLLEGTNFTNAAIKDLDENIFERTLAAAQKEFADQPRVRARLLQHLADTCQHLSLLERAETAQEESLSTRTHLLGQNHPDTLECIAGMARLRWQQSRFADAEPLAREAWVGRVRVLGADDPATWQSAHLLARVLSRLGANDESEGILRDLYERQRVGRGENDARTLETQYRLGEAILRREDPDRFHEAVGLIESSSAGLCRVLPESDETRLFAVGTLAIARAWAGRLDESVEILEGLIPTMRRELGDDNWMPWYFTSQLAVTYLEQGRSAEAEPLAEDAVSALRRVVGNESVYTRMGLAGLARVLPERGRLAEAEEALRELLAAAERRGETDKGYMDLRLAHILDRTGDPGKATEADEIRRAVIAYYESTYGPNDPQRFGGRFKVAWNLYLCGRAAEAEPIAREALEGYRRLAPASWKATDALGSLAAIVYASRGPEAAAPLFEQLENGRFVVDSGVNRWRVYIWIQHARCLTELGRFKEAERELDRCWQMLATFGYQRHPIELMKAYIDVYGAGDGAEPGSGRASQADAWRERLPAFARNTDPPVPGA